MVRESLKQQAMLDFRQARRRAAMEQIVARLTGQSVELLSYEDVRQKFRLGGGSSRGLQEIPLEAVVGSVGRYTDFTRSFLPKWDNDEDRWAGVQAATLDATGLPPIDVYKIGQVYFVVDGNHRVSVARQLGASYIQAYVTELVTKVPLQPGDKPDDILIKAEYADFLEKTKLDKLRPQSNFEVTVPGRYWELETQIEAHRFLLSTEQEREVSGEEAVCYWYDNIYLPVVQIIRERAILRDFPGRTETDMYLWIFRHRAELEKKLGWQIDPESAALDLASQHSSEPRRVLSRVEGKMWDILLPDELEAGPSTGQWRRDWLEARPRNSLFSQILVSINGTEESWCAFEQALIVARREQAQLRGLHVMSDESETAHAYAQAVATEFERRCQVNQLAGGLSIEIGAPARKISERAGWVDLVVVHLAHPPGPGPLEKLNSGFRTLLYRCPRPVLTVPGRVTPLIRALVAYDGSPKAREGLYMATYLAEAWDELSLVVVTVSSPNSDKTALQQAKEHLTARGLSATYLEVQGEPADAILQVAAEQQCDLIVMGGYSFKPILQVVFGSTVDQILRESKLPLLICR